MDERPDIAILLPNLGAGGAERVCLSLAREFAGRGLKVEMVLLESLGDWVKTLPAGVSLVSLEAPRLRNALRPLTRYLRTRRPRAMLASLWPLTSLAVWARILAGARTRMVLVDHSDYRAAPESASTRSRLKLTLSLRASYGLADGVVGVSRGVADGVAVLAGLRPHAVSVIHNPIEPPGDADSAPNVADAWLAHPGPRLVAVGSLNPAKNFPLLLRAFRQVRDRTDARLLILGEGRLRPELEALARNLSVAEVTSMPGYVAHPHAFMRKADLLVLSSDWEGFGNVLVEAMSCGTPVVATDCRSGPREILEDGRHGRLTPPGDADKLAEAILATLAETPDRKALKRRAADFAPAHAAGAYLRLLRPSGSA